MMPTPNTPTDWPPAPNYRIRPWMALRALLRVIRDPEDTESGALFVLALDGRRPEVTFQRFAADPRGRRLLAERRSLRTVLCDRAALRALPSESLGRRYLAFMEEESISLEDLARATERVPRALTPLDPDREFVFDHLVYMHDLLHVVNGYSRDLLGEVQLLAFNHVQLRRRAFGWIPWAFCLFNERRAPGSRRLVALARERALRARWLPAQDWEALLPLPLAIVRDQLGAGPPPPYTRYFRGPGGRGLIAESPDAPPHALAA